ncbi:MAG: recombinase family protein [Patescibacteria group bacterium]|jgi:DNA invertase Pin-like site-specific DNA recombinase
MKAVLYCRVSSKEQEETGYSLPAQEKLLESYSVKNNFNINKRFSISESASGTKQRIVFFEMMDYVKKHNIKIIICEKVDRLTRNFRDAVMIDDWLEKDEERQIHLVKDSLIMHKGSRSQEKLNWGIRILFAKNYIDNLGEEVIKGQMEKLKKGWLPTRPPLGYRTTGEEKHRIHIIDETKAPLIKKMFDFYATGNYSLKKLVETMYQEGLRTRKGNKLKKSQMARYLSEPFYIGKNRWQSKVYEGKQKTFISEEVFDNVQKALKNKNHPKYNKHLFLFKGVIRCAECEGTIAWEQHKGITYGHCNHYKNCSQKVWVKEPEIEKQILKNLDKFTIKNKRIADWIKRALRENHREEIDYHSNSINELNKAYKQTQHRLDMLYEDRLDSKIDEESYERRFRKYSEDKEKTIKDIRKHSNANIKYFELGINIYEISQKAKEIYLSKPPEEKRQLINLIFDAFSLNKNLLGMKHSKAFEILLKAIQTTNSSKVNNFTKNHSRIFEPDKFGSNSTKNRVLDPVRSAWGDLWYDFRTFCMENHGDLLENIDKLV